MMNRRLVRGLVGVVVVAGLVTGVLFATSAARADYGAQPGTFSHAFADGCMDVAGGNDGNGIQIGNWVCNNTPAQQFRFTSAGEIRTLHNRCVSVKGANPASGTIVRQWTCDGNNSQKWRFVGQIVNVSEHGRRPLFDAENRGITTILPDILGAQWLYEPATGIILNDAGECLTVGKRQLTTESCARSGTGFVLRQRWTIGANGSLRPMIFIGTNECLHSNYEDESVTTHICDGSDAQRWALRGYLQSALGPARGSGQLLLQVDAHSYDNNYAIYNIDVVPRNANGLDGWLWYPLPE